MTIDIWTYAAVTSWCIAAYMLPVVAMIVWIRRKRDPAEIIQEYDTEETQDDEL